MSDSRTDRELALAASGGAREALGVLLERHYDRIYRLAWRLTGTASDAEDVAQDVCVKLATAIRSFRGDAEFGTWIWRIAHNAATDLLRQRQRLRPADPSEMMSLVDGAQSADGGSLNGLGWPGSDADRGEDLWVAVRLLTGQQREAVLLVYGEEMSHAEAAAAMGCTEKTVSWHLHEARKRLKKMLSPDATVGALPAAQSKA